MKNKNISFLLAGIFLAFSCNNPKTGMGDYCADITVHELALETVSIDNSRGSICGYTYFVW